MSLEDTFLTTRIGRSSTYRCQIGHHNYGPDHLCSHCGVEENPAEPKMSRITLISNLDELARWHHFDTDEFADRLLLNLNLEGELTKEGLVIYAEVSPAQIKKVLSD